MANELILNAIQKENIPRVRTLIVEDNDVDRLLLRTNLENMGMQHIQEATNGSEGLFKASNAKVLKSQFHLVMTDWKMPRTDGLTFLMLLRDEKSKFRIYVIMLTTVVDEVKISAALASGIDDCIVKPFKAELLKKRVLTCLEKN